MDIQIRSLNGVGFDTLYKSFYNAFIDYEMQLKKNELETMLQRRGFAPELSFGAFLNDELIAFTFNGIGFYDGKKTAYDTGTGTIKEYRGIGLATRIFMHSIPFLKKAGVVQYLLEVLQHNEKAVSVYKNVGFIETREFNYFIKEDFVNKIVPEDDKVLIRKIDLAYQNQMRSFMDFEPSWQNSFDSIKRRLDDFEIYGAFILNELVGYCIFEPNTGDVTQIAVRPDQRRKNIGTQLLTYSVRNNKHSGIKVINSDTSCLSIECFLENYGILIRGKQFEMIKKL